MYELLKGYLLKLLKVPPEPEDPMGDVNSLLVFRASWNYFRYRFMFWVIGSTVGLLTTLLVPGIWLIFFYLNMQKNGRHSLSLVMLIVIIAALVLYALLQTLVSYLALRLDYELRWYKVSDRSLRIREGVMNVRELTMTFANIQNIEIIQGPIQRLFGIADLKVESAGGGSGGGATAAAAGNQQCFHLAYFRGIENATEIRDLMRSRLEKIRSSGLGDDLDKESHVPATTPALRPTPGQDDYRSLLREIRTEAQRLHQTVASAQS